MANVGKVSQIIGPAVDVEFAEGKQPEIHTAIHITSEGFNVPSPLSVIAEVQQHLGEGRVRCISMQPTDGMVRGMPAKDMGGPITIPVGAGALGRGEAACRQLAARARAHIDAGRPRFPTSQEEGHRLAAAFHEAAASGDLHRLTQLLAHDAVLYSDGGGKRAAALKPIYGADKILRFLEGVSRKSTALQTMQVRVATINGLAGFVMREADGSVNTMAFECNDGRIVAIYVVRNPEKLRHVQP